MTQKQEDGGASPDGDQAVVNGAGQAVSALRASVPSAGAVLLNVVVVPYFEQRNGNFHYGATVTWRSGVSLGEAVEQAVDYAHDQEPYAHQGRPLKLSFAVSATEIVEVTAQGIEAGTATTGTGVVHGGGDD